MINWILKKIVGSKNQRDIKRMRPAVDRINQLEQEYQALSDDDLRAKTAAWKEQLSKIEDPVEQRQVLDGLLPEAFDASKEPLDYYQLDHRYWDSFIYRPAKM